MPTALALQLESQNRRCDFCSHGDTFPVPTLLISSRERESPSGETSLRIVQRMMNPKEDVFCQLLHARVRASGQCDKHEVPTK